MPGESMRAMVLPAWGEPFAEEERLIPSPSRTQVQVRVASVGIGVTNELARNGVLGGSVPRIPGHEFAGTITAVGSAVTHWLVGDRVMATFYLLCGSCRWCASGRESLCERFGGFFGVETDGAFADFLVIEADALVRVPANVPLRDAGIISDAIATAYHAIVTRARVAPGERVAVIGAGGGLGVHVLQMARAAGAMTIALERDTAKTERLRDERLADRIYAPASRDDENTRRNIGPVDVVVDTYGGPDSLTLGVRLLGRAGRLVVLGQVPDATVRLTGAGLLFDELSVMGTRYASRAEIAASAAMVADGRIRPIYGASFPLTRLNEALTAAVEGRVFGRIRIDVSEEGSE